MSLLTRCPACTTLYKVVPDQLRISQGWVKCGQCGEIFDASQHLMEASTEPEELPEQPAAESTPAVPPESPGTDQATQGQPAPLPASEPDRESAQDPEGSSSQSAIPELDQAPGPNLAQGDQLPVTAADELASTDQNDDAANDEQADQVLEPIPDLATEADAVVPVPLPEAAESAPEALPLSFMRDARPAGRWQGALGKQVLAAGAGLLSLLLLTQWLYQEHDRLAAARPAWTPALQAFCLALRCSVAPLQQIESLAIDAAAFSKIGADRYRLSFTLKNSAPLPLALPSIELTLTDDQERAVIRRVLSLRELAAPAGALPASSEWPVSSTLRIEADAALPAVVGYRLLAFYP